MLLSPGRIVILVFFKREIGRSRATLRNSNVAESLTGFYTSLQRVPELVPFRILEVIVVSSESTWYLVNHYGI